MAKPFNVKFVKQMLQEEDKFISDIFALTPFPVSKLTDEELNEEDEEQMPPKKGLDGTNKRAQTFEELHARLDALKNTKKLDYKQKLLKKNIKNRIRKKTKREERLRQKKLAITEQNASNSKRPNDESNGIPPKVPRPKPVFNSEGRMVFSKFDFSEIGTKKKPQKSEKDPKKMLQQLQQKKEKLKELEEAGEKEKALEMKEKDAWRAALARSSGEKVKDDPDLLKQSIKKQEQKKKHSAKKWESRIQNVQKMKQEKQEKRKENIMKKKREKKVTKLKKAAKKGRVIAGF